MENATNFLSLEYSKEQKLKAEKVLEAVKANPQQHKVIIAPIGMSGEELAKMKGVIKGEPKPEFVEQFKKLNDGKQIR